MTDVDRAAERPHSDPDQFEDRSHGDTDRVANQAAGGDPDAGERTAVRQAGAGQPDGSAPAEGTRGSIKRDVLALHESKPAKPDDSDDKSDKPVERNDDGARGDAGRRQSRDDDGRGAKQQAEGRPADEDEGESSKRDDGDAPRRPPPLPSKWPFLIAGILLVLLLAWSGYGHWRQRQDALNTRDDTVNAVPNVETIEAKRNDRPRSLVLPGQTQAFDTASLYPRATGYVAQRLVDIGSRVRKDDLLIHITAPDLDQQLAQAEAQLGQTEASLSQAQAQVGQAEANLGLAKVTFARTNQLTQQGYDTVQNHDNQQANLTTQQAGVETAKAGVRVAESNIRSQKATVDRLKALAAFEDIKAPFDGVITARSVDVGDLLNADMSSGSPIFRIDRDDTIRVSVYVPQGSAIDLHEGLDAKVTVAQLPGRTFVGKVARSSVSLDASSRSLTAQIDVPNPDHALRSGLYVLVDFEIPRQHPSVEVPAEALIFNQHGMQVATVENGSQVKIRPVTIDRDMGTSVELREGLKGGEQVVISPPATLSQDAKVKATPRKEGDDQNGKPDQSPKTKEAQADQQKHDN